MEIKEVLFELEYNNGSFPYEAVQEAITQKDKIISEDRLGGENSEDKTNAH
jgi:hypothetical protein